MPDLACLGRTAEREFLEIVNFAVVIGNKLRVEMLDGSYIDFWWSTQIPGRYAYHWERGHIDGTIYRHDNIPHLRWQGVSTFPKHFHFGDRQTVTESNISDVPEEGLIQFLEFAARHIG